MKKDAYYFPHFCNARNDKKIKRLRSKIGNSGFSIYFMLLEVLREEAGFKYPITDIDLLADDFKEPIDMVKAVIYFGHENGINDPEYTLFQFDESHNFFSAKFNFYMQPYLEKSQRAINAANLRWKSVRKSSDTNNDANALPEQCDSNATKLNETKLNETKLNEKIVKENTSKHLFRNSPYFDFDHFKKSIDPKYQKYDLEYYHEVARGYSESKGAMYKDWLAAIRNWLLRDINDGKARIINKTLSIEEQRAERMRKIQEQFEKINQQ